ncbi:unnamed protein product [Heterobilharzia americana]|nr:unnamed protein product [Heterobilharzia americana]
MKILKAILMIFYWGLYKLIISVIYHHIGYVSAADDFQVKYAYKINTPSKMDRNDVFRKPSLLVCSPDPIQLHCPSHMYIKPLETKVIYNIQTTGEPEFISPSCSFKRSQPKRKENMN